ncbi:phosphoribosyltransferase [Guyparkeria sp.]|uniref:phosphoribosyltransferase n=1 Tax=Guyparkeria sp. TaxID=2035736 RepID=UPI0039709EDC
MFRNREEAAEQIAARLEHHRGSNPLVLAIPRGGVPMGQVIADRLEGELDIVLVHKIGAPGNPEFAIGSVDETGHVELNPGVERYGISPDYIDSEAERQLENIRKRRQRYRRPPTRAEGRVAILVDDGIATGATLFAAIRSLRAQNPSRLVVGVGVAPPDTVERIRREVDELVCLEAPAEFMAVGQFFQDFRQVEDEEVIAALGGESS